MLRQQILALSFLLFTFSACTQTADGPGDAATSAAADTQAVLASPSPTRAFVAASALPTVSFSTTPVSAGDLPTAIPPSYPTITASSTSSVPPTITPTAVVLPPNFSPVLLGKKYDSDTFFTLLGGVQGGNWLSADQAAANIAGASAYDVYAFASGPHPVYGYAPEKSMPHREYFLSTDSGLNETGMIGVVQGWQVTHRAAEELPANKEMYRQVVRDFLIQAGVVDPQIGTMHIYRIDLEGDGTDEIFISDTRVESSHGVVAGDHSVILMRKVSASGAITIPILVDLYATVGYGNPFPCSYFIANFVDLNRDGVLEVMATYDRWEGFGASVYEVQGEAVEQVLGTTCINP